MLAFQRSSRLARLVKDLACAAATQAYVESIFSASGLVYSGRRRAMFGYLEMSACIKLRQCWKNVLPTVTDFQRLGVNVAELM